eukprot:Amastigsp_a73_2543.p5 type:complete len:129 gc:universal Amastigsp_a73_2543:501-887(+)
MLWSTHEVRATQSKGKNSRCWNLIANAGSPRSSSPSRNESDQAKNGIVLMSGSPSRTPSMTLGIAWWVLCLAFHHETEKPWSTFPRKSPIQLPYFLFAKTWWWRKSCESHPHCCQKSAMRAAPSSAPV